MPELSACGCPPAELIDGAMVRRHALENHRDAPAPIAVPPWDEVTKWLRANHKITFSGLELQHWRCSCGAESALGFGYSTHPQARARSDRHLKAQRRRYAEAFTGSEA